MQEKTIAAISTALGESAVGMIRISGSEAIAVADRVFCAVSGKPLSSLKGYAAAYGEVKDGERVIDDGVALVFRAPKSYTGEDVVEITLHGGRLLLLEALRLILENGAKPAAPGEFTKRAFLNGKTDLTKAESIMGLISAKSSAELRLSRAAHLGKISKSIAEIEEHLLLLDASIAAFSDYPDEELEGVSPAHFAEHLDFAENALQRMLSSYEAGRVLREGVETAIVGKPNVGKSTVMNLLSGTERSIVTEIPGTTRDVVEESVIAGGVCLRLADTAGIRKTEDAVEAIGVSRAKDRLDTAELVLAVLDASRPLDEDDRALLAALRGRTCLVILNKNDLPEQIDRKDLQGFYTVETSALNGEGYEALCAAIGEITHTAGLDPDSAVLMNERQRACAAKAYESIKEAKNALASGFTTDAVGVCVDDALAALYELTGKRVTNEVAEEIFEHFCVGK